MAKADKKNKQHNKDRVAYSIALKLKEKNISSDIILYATGVKIV